MRELRPSSTINKTNGEQLSQSVRAYATNRGIPRRWGGKFFSALRCCDFCVLLRLSFAFAPFRALSDVICAVPHRSASHRIGPRISRCVLRRSAPFRVAKVLFCAFPPVFCAARRNSPPRHTVRTQPTRRRAEGPCLKWGPSLRWGPSFQAGPSRQVLGPFRAVLRGPPGRHMSSF